ncbi:hypothetical protein DGo_PB0449 (plasmid) [Deinococcus gobiensis I-0]|uniref:Uncharacterized protein n=1 Tax=Deinococcus gobiensis (strain DSM 21396 / JCM 16679 / CGMCC 1.7299 / I-0) TaxID=745776 RepID=H8H2H1_DEIGI|nr:hypothetical protein DGo_PB0449 [Deinococcus gobiensis I-0]
MYAMPCHTQTRGQHGTHAPQKDAFDRQLPDGLPTGLWL